MKSASVRPQTNKKSTARVPLLLAGMAGFGPTNVGVKVLCLTAWRHPNNTAIITHKTRYVNEKSLKSARISKKPFLMLKLNQKKALTKNKDCAILFRRRDRMRISFRSEFNARGVAQLGRALGSGPRGRWFKSSHSDHSVFISDLVGLIWTLFFCPFFVFISFSVKLHIAFIDFCGQVCYNSDKLENAKTSKK